MLLCTLFPCTILYRQGRLLLLVFLILSLIVFFLICLVDSFLCCFYLCVDVAGYASNIPECVMEDLTLGIPSVTGLVRTPKSLL